MRQGQKAPTATSFRPCSQRSSVFPKFSRAKIAIAPHVAAIQEWCCRPPMSAGVMSASRAAAVRELLRRGLAADLN